MSLSLTPQCAVCDKTENLLRCSGCKVVLYCGKHHQKTDRRKHKSACTKIEKAQENLDHEESELRAIPADAFTPAGATIFEDHAGYFWGLMETRDYMRARYGLVEAILGVKSIAATQAALDHVMDLLRLCRSDNMGVRDMVPGLYLRLGRDQECYDFGDMDEPFLDVKDADAFESVDLHARKYAELCHTVAVTLLKIRLLRDVKELQNAAIVGDKMGDKIPPEVMDNIRRQLVSSIVAKRKDIIESRDQGLMITELEGQIEELFAAVEKSNDDFWLAILEPQEYLTEQPEEYSRGSLEEVQFKLQYCYDAWAETPGAIEIIRELVENGGQFSRDDQDTSG